MHCVGGWMHDRWIDGWIDASKYGNEPLIDLTMSLSPMNNGGNTLSYAVVYVNIVMVCTTFFLHVNI